MSANSSPRESRLLVIDDEPLVAELLKDALSCVGSVDVALSGNDGLRLAESHRYDLVFTDLGMPDISGWELSRRLLEKTPDLPVVLVTGWAATLDQEEVKRHGISAVIHKPFEISELLQTATALLSL